MVFSFSSLENVHVEYTSLPPGRSIRDASSRIHSCLSAHINTLSSVHSSTAVCDLLNMPSPEHGASTSILSKNPANLPEIFLGSSLITSAFFTPILSIFSDKIRALSGIISLATRIPSPFSISAICVLLPPGAAHKSSTLSPGSASRYIAGDIAEGSCM